MAKAYIESSVPSYYVARPSRQIAQLAKQQLTKDWWDGGCSGLELVTSLITLDEMKLGESAKATERLALVEEIPLLEVNGTVFELAAQLVDSRLVPQKSSVDAMHIALAAIYSVEYLVTWNFKHIANPFMRERICKLIEAEGFLMPIMCSPEQLLETPNPTKL